MEAGGALSPALLLRRAPAVVAATTPIGELAARCDTGDVVLSEPQIPGSGETSTHVALTRSAVWVIGTPLRPDTAEVLWTASGEARLLIAGTDGREQLSRLSATLRTVTDATNAFDPDIAVYGAVCLPQAALPRFRRLRAGGWPLLSPRALSRRLGEPGPLSDCVHSQLSWELDRTFDAAAR